MRWSFDLAGNGRAQGAVPTGTPTAIPIADQSRMRASLANVSILADLVAWGSRRGRDIIDVVIQDEYTHDVIIRWDDRWVLVFDTT